MLKAVDTERKSAIKKILILLPNLFCVHLSTIMKVEL